MKFKQIYLIGSLRNPEVPKVGDILRADGHGVFDNWFAGGPIADDSWQEYEKGRGRSYREALYGPAAKNIFEFDKRNLDASDAAILVMPAGKSGHLEMGYMSKDKPTFFLFDKEPDRWDVMLQFANDVFFSVDEMLEGLAKFEP